MAVAHPTKPTQERHLRLVTSSDEPPDPTPGNGPVDTTPRRTLRDLAQKRARHRTSLSDDARQLRSGVLRAALASGYAINPDAVSVIIAAKSLHQGPLRHFTEDSVWDLIWFDISHWCGTRQVDLPQGLHRALWFILGYLDSENELHPRSDHLDDLRSPLLSSGGLGPDGNPRFEY